MKLARRALVVLACLGVLACVTALPEPPVARVVPHRLEANGQARVDDYFWLREREDAQVIAYLEAENRYAEAMMADTEELQQRLFDEIVGRIQQTDETVPVLKNGYYRYRRYQEGQEYPIHCRKAGSLEAAEEVILDVNQLAVGHGYCSASSLSVSTDNRILAYALDTVGRRKYTIRFKDLSSGQHLADEIPEVTGELAWANDNQTLFYTRQDPETLRPYQVFRHRLGTDPGTDALVYEEADETFSVGVEKTRSDRFIFITSAQTMSSEYRYLDADHPEAEPAILQPRARGLEYSVDHLGDSFYIRTNLEAENFRLMAAPVESPGVASWGEVVPHRDDTYLADFALFTDFLVVSERREGLRRVRVIPWRGGDDHVVEFNEATYVVDLGENPENSSRVLRLEYASLTTPNTVYDYDMVTRELTLRKRDKVLGGFDPANYQAERLLVPARDGVRVPVSLVYRKGLNKDGSSPLLLYGYGSYGYSMEPWFSAEWISLLDRGFVCAIAHVRGGQEMGRRWYEDGKLLHKKNTFTDFVDCARFLVDHGYTSPDRLFAQGGSAGGLLMGAIANSDPGLFAGIIAEVPWVDVVTTMLDDSIPLTTAEYDEWGDPNNRAFYDYMLSYSPYDNVVAQAYPSMLITAGLHDSQVQYWEPAKWAAKLRALKIDDNLLLLKAEMEAGHSGPSGRYQSYRDVAFTYAFMLKVLGRVG